MHFYKVPRLGSFLAIPVVYNSCLTPDALENAIADYYEVQVRKEELDKEKAEYYDQRE